MLDRKSGRAKALRSTIFKEAEQELRRCEKETIRAANCEWELAEAISELLNAYGEPKIIEALSHLAALIASYRSEAVAPITPTIWSRVLRFLATGQAPRTAPSC